MTEEQQPEQTQPIQTPHVSFGRRLVNYFLTGLVIAGPIGITLYIAYWIIGSVDAFVKPLIPQQYNPDNFLPFHVPGYGLVVATLAVMLLGFLAANLVGRTLVQMGENLLSRVPMVSSLYAAIKQIFETVVTQSKGSFRDVGIIEYPRPGLWAAVFISTPTKGEIATKLDGEEMLSVFLPTTPNPTSGFLLFVPKRDVTVLDMSTEDAAKMIISAGLVAPEYNKKLAAIAKKKKREQTQKD